MKALVTGGGGYLGRHIVEQLLARGDEATVFARSNYPEMEKIGAKLFRGDVQDNEAVAEACRGMDAVFHVAARATAWGPWQSFYQTNVVGTENIIDACRRHGVSKLVYTSTPSVIANGKPRPGVNESHPYPDRFDNYYPQTKAMAEQLVAKANGPALSTVSLRPRAIFGPRDTQLLAQVVARAKAGRLIQIGEGTNKSDVTYIDDAARAHLLAADALEPGSPVAGSVYFINQGEPVKVWSFINDLVTQLGYPPIKRRISLPVARSVAHVIQWVYRTLRLKGEPLLVPFVVNELALDFYADISKARRDFGYEPQISVAEGLSRTVAYFRNNHS